MKVWTSSAAFVEGTVRQSPTRLSGRKGSVSRCCRQSSRPPASPARRRSGDSRPKMDESTTVSSFSSSRKKCGRKPKRGSRQSPPCRSLRRRRRNRTRPSVPYRPLSLKRRGGRAGPSPVRCRYRCPNKSNDLSMPPVIFSVDDSRRPPGSLKRFLPRLSGNAPSGLPPVPLKA